MFHTWRLAERERVRYLGNVLRHTTGIQLTGPGRTEVDKYIDIYRYIYIR
jgi:hypothetical protein